MGQEPSRPVVATTETPPPSNSGREESNRLRGSNPAVGTTATRPSILDGSQIPSAETTISRPTSNHRGQGTSNRAVKTTALQPYTNAGVQRPSNSAPGSTSTAASTKTRRQEPNKLRNCHPELKNRGGQQPCNRAVGTAATRPSTTPGIAAASRMQTSDSEVATTITSFSTNRTSPKPSNPAVATTGTTPASNPGSYDCNVFRLIDTNEEVWKFCPRHGSWLSKDRFIRFSPPGRNRQVLCDHCTVQVSDLGVNLDETPIVAGQELVAMITIHDDTVENRS
ncbi:hypothetical protein EDC01DRAFT_630673 [Geopyxis carbonaria]|nr:hypothetical protein EDC01DRAFT_630673 [Geopyxis carbonaria]